MTFTSKALDTKSSLGSTRSKCSSRYSRDSCSFASIKGCVSFQLYLSLRSSRIQNTFHSPVTSPFFPTGRVDGVEDGRISNRLVGHQVKPLDMVAELWKRCP